MFCHLDNCDNNLFLNTTGETDCVLQYVQKIVQHYEGKYYYFANCILVLFIVVYIFLYLSRQN